MRARRWLAKFGHNSSSNNSSKVADTEDWAGLRALLGLYGPEAANHAPTSEIGAQVTEAVLRKLAGVATESASQRAGIICGGVVPAIVPLLGLDHPPAGPASTVLMAVEVLVSLAGEPSSKLLLAEAGAVSALQRLVVAPGVGAGVRIAAVDALAHFARGATRTLEQRICKGVGSVVSLLSSDEEAVALAAARAVTDLTLVGDGMREALLGTDAPDRLVALLFRSMPIAAGHPAETALMSLAQTDIVDLILCRVRDSSASNARRSDERGRDCGPAAFDQRPDTAGPAWAHSGADAEQQQKLQEQHLARIAELEAEVADLATSRRELAEQKESSDERSASAAKESRALGEQLALAKSQTAAVKSALIDACADLDTARAANTAALAKATEQAERIQRLEFELRETQQIIQFTKLEATTTLQCELEKLEVAHAAELEALQSETPTPCRETPVYSDAGPATDNDTVKTPHGYTRVPGFGLVAHETTEPEIKRGESSSRLPQRMQRNLATYG